MRSDWGVYAQDRLSLGRATVAGRHPLRQVQHGLPGTGRRADASTRRTATSPSRSQDSTRGRTSPTARPSSMTCAATGRRRSRCRRTSTCSARRSTALASRPEPDQHAGDEHHPAVGRREQELHARLRPAELCRQRRMRQRQQPDLRDGSRGVDVLDDLRAGFDNRQRNWEFSASVQHELMRGVGMDFGYFRRIWENFQVTDNLALAASDFTPSAWWCRRIRSCPTAAAIRSTGSLRSSSRPSAAPTRMTTRSTATTASRPSTGTASTSLSTRASRTGCTCRAA